MRVYDDNSGSVNTIIYRPYPWYESLYPLQSQVWKTIMPHKMVIQQLIYMVPIEVYATP